MFNSKSKKCINIALDLGVFGDRAFAKGIEDLAKAMPDRKSTRLNSSHVSESRMPSSA